MREAASSQGCRLYCQTSRVLSFSLCPQSCLSDKEGIQVGPSASERLLAAFPSKLESRRKNCSTSCHQHLRKLRCSGNYRFPMVFPQRSFQGFFFFLSTEQKPHKNRTVQQLQTTKMRETMVIRFLSGSFFYIAFQALLPTADVLVFPGSLSHPLSLVSPHPLLGHTSPFPTLQQPSTSSASHLPAPLIGPFSSALHTHHLLNTL